MKKSIINIAQTSQLSWHSLTSMLYQGLIHCYDNEYIKKLYVLAIFVGYYVVQGVTPALNTPLME